MRAVSSIQNKESTKPRPEGINTSQLLKHSSSVLGIGPQDAMNVAEDLYLGGYITYPRTETTMYNPGFDFASVLHALARSPLAWAKHAVKLLQAGFSVSKQGLDAGDHPPITPTSKTPPLGALADSQSVMYDYICRHFLATLSRDAKFAKTKVVFEFGEEVFSTQGVLVVDPGFTEIVPWVKITNRLIPLFQKGEKHAINSVEIKEFQTLPPSYLSESELITLMEKYCIGTDASMATHINTICQRNFVEILPKGRRLKPTPLGNALVLGYKSIDEELISAELRSSIERNVDQIAKGKADINEVLKSVLLIFKEKYVFFRDNISKLEVHFMQVFGTFHDSLKKGVPFSSCGRCSTKMVLVEDFNKIYCKTCKVTLNLPRDATYSLEGLECCPIDNYQIINYYIRKPG